MCVIVVSCRYKTCTATNVTSSTVAKFSLRGDYSKIQTFGRISRELSLGRRTLLLHCKMDEKTKNSTKHRDVVVKLRERLEQYRKRHSDIQSKQERNFAMIENQERQETLMLQQHRKAMENRNVKLMNKIKQQEITKNEHPSNGLELKTTNAILQVM